MTVTQDNVSVEKNPQVILLTEEAQAKVAELLAEEENSNELVLRVAVKPGGCSGFNYDMYFDTETASDDVVLSFGDVRVAVDQESAELLKGSTLEYEDGLQGAGFHIVNPNATRTCGCGNSFC
jgi:iron-sulfur cluster assembly protein/iron-sulfur cluster insertion protein